MTSTDNIQNSLKENKKCETHLVEMSKCSKCDILTCRECVFYNKSILFHMKEHYDYIDDVLNSDNDLYTQKINEYEGYEILNKVYKEVLSEIDNFIEKAYERIEYNKTEIERRIKDFIIEKYMNYTSKFESLVKEVNLNMNELNFSDKESKEKFYILKKKLDDYQEYLESEEIIKIEMEKLFQKAKEKIEKMKVFDFIQSDCHFNIGVNNESLDLIGGNGNIVKSNVVQSEEVLLKEFEVRIRINKFKLSEEITNQDLAYIGIIKLNSYCSNETFFSNSILISSNGSLLNKNLKTSSKNSFLKKWKEGDVVFIKRDSKGNVYFGINQFDDNSLILSYKNIVGEYRVVIAIPDNRIDNEFELIEIKQ